MKHSATAAAAAVTPSPVNAATPDDAFSLASLRSVGPRTLEDFALLGIDSVATLAKAEARELYERLAALKGVRLDPCCLDVFNASVAQARSLVDATPLADELRNWWTWSRLRKRHDETLDDRGVPTARKARPEGTRENRAQSGRRAAPDAARSGRSLGSR